MSNTLGYVLLASSAAPGLLGWDLARRGIAKVDLAAEKADQVAKQAKAVVADSQRVTAEATGGDAARVASTNAEVVQQTSAVTDAVSDVRDALKGLTGVFAPARVFLSIAVLLIVAALFALDVISISAGQV
jgi:hypothetical protein